MREMTEESPFESRSGKKLRQQPSPPWQRPAVVLAILLLLLVLWILFLLPGSPVSDGVGVAGSFPAGSENGVQSSDQAFDLLGGVVVDHADPDHSIALCQT